MKITSLTIVDEAPHGWEDGEALFRPMPQGRVSTPESQDRGRSGVQDEPANSQERAPRRLHARTLSGLCNDAAHAGRALWCPRKIYGNATWHSCGRRGSGRHQATGIAADCCAKATRGQAAAATPSNVTNSRRLIDRLTGQKATLYHTDGKKSCAVQNSKSGCFGDYNRHVAIRRWRGRVPSGRRSAQTGKK